MPEWVIASPMQKNVRVPGKSPHELLIINDSTIDSDGPLALIQVLK